MATYTISAPNGKTYSITGPSGASQQEVQDEVLRQHPEAAGEPAPAAAARPQSMQPALDPHAPASSGIPAEQLAGFNAAPNRFSLKEGAMAVPGAAEAALSALTGTGAAAVGSLGYLGTLLARRNMDEADQAKSDVEGALTYQPRSNAGQALVQGAGAPFQAVDRLADYTAGKFADANMPVAATAAKTLISGAPWLLGLHEMAGGTRFGRPAPAAVPDEAASEAPGAAPGVGPTPPQPLGGIAAPPPAAVPAAPMPAPPAAGPAAPPSSVAQVLDALHQEGGSVDALKARLAAAAAAGKPLSIAEAARPGEAVQSLTRTLHTLGGEGRSIVRSNTEGSVEGMPERVKSDITEMSGQPEVSTTAALAEQQASMSGKGDAAYSKAYSQGALDSPELATKLESNPAYVEAHEQARSSYNAKADRGTEIPPLFDAEGKLTRAPTVQDIDLIKRGFDAEEAGTHGVINDTQAALKKASVAKTDALRQAMLKIVDPLAPDYAETRRMYTNEFEMKKARQLGDEIIARGSSADPVAIRLEVNKMSAEARDAFRQAVAAKLRRDVAAKTDTGGNVDVSRVAAGSKGGLTREVLNAVFGDTPTLQKFLQQSEAESARAGLRNFATRGSQTGEKGADALRHAATFAEAATHGLAGIAYHAARATADTVISKVHGARNAATARELTTPRHMPHADPFLRALSDAEAKRKARTGDGGGIY